MTGDGLKVEVNDAVGRGKIRFPYEPPSEYDLNVEVTRLKQGPHTPLFFHGVLDGRPYYVGFGVDHNHENRIWGSSDKDAVRTATDATFADNQRYRIRVEVRKDRLSAYLDEKLTANCVVKPNEGEFGREWWTGEHVIGMGTWDTLVIHSMKVTEIGHGGTLLALPPTGELPHPLQLPAEAPIRVVNLMPLIDVHRDVIEGVWEATPGGGVASAGGTSGCAFPISRRKNMTCESHFAEWKETAEWAR